MKHRDIIALIRTQLFFPAPSNSIHAKLNFRDSQRYHPLNYTSWMVMGVSATLPKTQIGVRLTFQRHYLIYCFAELTTLKDVFEF